MFSVIYQHNYASCRAAKQEFIQLAQVILWDHFQHR